MFNKMKKKNKKFQLWIMLMHYTLSLSLSISWWKATQNVSLPLCGCVSEYVCTIIIAISCDCCCNSLSFSPCVGFMFDFLLCILTNSEFSLYYLLSCVSLIFADSLDSIVIYVCVCAHDARVRHEMYSCQWMASAIRTPEQVSKSKTEMV